MTFVAEFQVNHVVTTTLLVHSKEIRQKRSGEPYLSLVLGDRTGDIDSKMWDNVAEVMDTFDCDDFVKVKGQPCLHNGRLQLTVHKIQKLDEASVNLGDFFPASKRDPEEMMVELRGYIEGIGNGHLRGLLEAIFADSTIAHKFKRAPAAKSIHHAYLGGLLEHVLSVCGLSRMMARHYRRLDEDLLMAGAILHDLGKIDELTYERGFGYSSDGQLLGHISLGLRLIAEKLAHLPPFPPRLRTLLEHMILSHHGKLEFGSPKIPLFPEALMLHYLDDLDSKMECMRATVEQDRMLDSEWTSFSNALERIVLKKSSYPSDTEEVTGNGARATGSTDPGAKPESARDQATPEGEPSAERAAGCAPVPSRILGGPETAQDGALAESIAPDPRLRFARNDRIEQNKGTPSVFGEKLFNALKKED
jgi:3'-5' exoribonuclease